MKQVTLFVVGAGARGSTYSEYAIEFPERLKIVGVAEPRDEYCQRFVNKHNIKNNIFSDWRRLVELPKLADGVIIASPDRNHFEQAVAFASKGYDILLEKPIAVTVSDCTELTKVIQKANIKCSVCHVLRYTNYTRRLKQLLDDNAIGDIVSIEHLEPIGWWHYAHSFVRGNWNNDISSAPMLLAKSCHDFDWLRYIIGVPCKRVSSFGTLFYFRKEKKPAQATDRCWTCPLQEKCVFSANKFYFERLQMNFTGWPLDVVTLDFTPQGLSDALKNGPYGRCVWACDNNVTDSQVANMEFEGGQTASFTVTAFTEGRDRQTRIYGTAGELRGDGNKIEIYNFASNRTLVHEANVLSDGGITSGHGGGDFGVIDNFVSAIANNESRYILSGINESLESHLMAHAAEIARRENRVVELTEMNSYSDRKY